MRAVTFYLIALVVVIADQVTKRMVTARLPLHGSEHVIGSFLSITYTQNTGGAFSLLQAKNGVFILIAVLAMGALAYAYHRSPRRSLLVNAAIALALGGAIGNLIDRICLGYVIDFFDLRWQFFGPRSWPIFNVADSAISIGIVLLAIHLLFPHKEPMPAPPATDEFSTGSAEREQPADASRTAPGV